MFVMMEMKYFMSRRLSRP